MPVLDSWTDEYMAAGWIGTFGVSGGLGSAIFGGTGGRCRANRESQTCRRQARSSRVAGMCCFRWKGRLCWPDLASDHQSIIAFMLEGRLTIHFD